MDFPQKNDVYIVVDYEKKSEYYVYLKSSIPSSVIKTLPIISSIKFMGVINGKFLLSYIKNPIEIDNSSIIKFYNNKKYTVLNRETLFEKSFIPGSHISVIKYMFTDK